jgi:hypothetical protein
MAHPLEHLIQKRIEEAMEQGDFNQLSCSGKPLPNLDQPAEDCLARVVREQGGKPAFVLLNGKIQALIQRMGDVTDPLAKRAIEQQIADLRTRMALEKERES